MHLEWCEMDKAIKSYKRSKSILVPFSALENVIEELEGTENPFWPFCSQ